MDKKCVLIQANGDGTRMQRFFNVKKHLLYYNNKRIIEHIIDSCIVANVDYYIVAKEDDTYVRSLTNNIIEVGATDNRVQTINKALPFIDDKYQTIVAHDCDVIFNPKYIDIINNDCLSVSMWKKDGLQYGFVDIDNNFDYIKGNEKQTAYPFISSGLYSFNRKRFTTALEHRTFNSMIGYYNSIRGTKVIYSKEYVNLGDINNFIGIV